jgi:hypothetical protein
VGALGAAPPRQLQSLVVHGNQPTEAVVQLCNASAQHLKALVLINIKPLVVTGSVFAYSTASVGHSAMRPVILVTARVVVRSTS